MASDRALESVSTASTALPTAGSSPHVNTVIHTTLVGLTRNLPIVGPTRYQ